ncbi:cytochrome oxidase assembly protein 1 [Purpureocillium takamizusanense]|uniref:Cytochrome oxidase assembly protein 1 n=1 Tax=Purpureocillium takamizusanense TaxID=2060973 RepID=A0A9Q8QIB6_9HYPO|nr:cytochrome oxidase assembly protein 1 [Purpureocillium takamizusanense]UNI20363.1 cytochrome oxidase assembly protein 1 [Purpureocillium takamizusanense]
MLSQAVRHRVPGAVTSSSLRQCSRANAAAPSPSSCSRLPPPSPAWWSRGPAQRRWNTPAPRPGEGPLMSRRADRELPDIKQTRFRWSRSLPLFLAVVAVSGLAIFNYQKTSSPIVASTLYALRTSPRARALLGDDIYFKHPIPWIRGEMNQLQGRIDIHFAVRGSRGSGVMRFASNRPSSRALFETTQWSLKMDDAAAAADGDWVDLLEDGDPFRTMLNDDVPPPPSSPSPAPAVEDAADLNATRGFRQQGALNK